MTKTLSYIHWVISALYIILNFKKIRGAFRSDVWSQEIDLINHVTNYTVHLQVISILLVLGGLILVWVYAKDIAISKFIFIPLIAIAAVLLINTQIDFIRWIEINIFGSLGLLLFTLLLCMQAGWRAARPALPKT